jgi:P27 family predicted phage terminase small subunit
MSGEEQILHDRAKQEVASFILLCPAELNAIARTEWKRVVTELVPLGLLKPLDLALVSLYCNAYAGWLEATAAVNEYGPVIKTPNGYPAQSPYVTLANQHAAVMLRCSAELGLSPASRIKNLGERKSTVWGSWDGSLADAPATAK